MPSPTKMLATLMPSINDNEDPSLAPPLPESGSDALAGPPSGRKTMLKLTDEQLLDAERYIKRRIDELMIEMGLEFDGRVVENSWMAVRQRHQDYYDNLLDYRKQPGSIFMESNVTTGENKRYVREMTAKVADDLIGTSPFYSAVRRPLDLSETADAIEEYIQLKTATSNVQAELKLAIRVAFIRNEAVVKTYYDNAETPYIGPATVMVDRNGEAIRTPSGQFVYQDDDFFPDPNVEGLFRLRKDPLFVMRQGQYAYKHFPALEQMLKQKDGVSLSILDHRSFLCPLRYDDIHKADANIQLFSMTEAEVEEKYGGFESFAIYDRRMSDEASGEDLARTAQGEIEDQKTSDLVRKFRMAECYVRFDPDGTGRQKETMFVINLTHGKAVFWDYLANQMGRRPFEVIVGVEREPHRWYGVGVLHMMEDTGLYIDSQFNRINVKDSREQSATFRDPNAVKEWKHGAITQLGTNYIHDLEPGYDRDNRPPLFRINLQEVSDIGMLLMEKMQQAGNMQFGVISVKDASANNLNNSRTATGVLNMERTANVLTKSTENDMAIGIMAVLQQFAETVLENMQDREVFFSRNGEQLMTMNREECRMLEVSVNLLLTRSRSSESLATNAQVIAIVKDYRIMMLQDPEGARMMRDFYIEQLKALEVKDADKRLPEITDEMIKAHADAQAAAQQAANDANLKALINYKDLPETVKRQMEQDAGYEPAPPEEIAADKKADRKTDAKPSKPPSK